MYLDPAKDTEIIERLGAFSALSSWSRPLKRMKRELVGREREIRSLMASFARAELSNVILLGDAGSGKTSIVQGAMVRDTHRIYLEVDMAAMLDGIQNEDQIGTRLQQLFDDTSRFQRDSGRDVVLFIDEFHKIVQKSASAVEDLKPLLADSATRGIRVVAATTYTEFREFIAPNQALVERLQRLNVSEADHDMTIAILTGMSHRYGVTVPTGLLETIYMMSQRYIPANAQPRKSILLLDSMIGWHREFGDKMDRELLRRVILEQEGVEIDSETDPETVRQRLDEAVYAQRFATLSVERRLQLCLAKLNDPEKPQATFLFSGSTGSGKTALSKALADVMGMTLIRFDMTEFSQATSAERFRRDLADAIWAHPRAVVLLDEIEKSCGEVTRMLLPVLDDARLIDANGREVSFKNSFIVLTTNAGAEVYRDLARYEQSDTGEGEFLEVYERLIRRSLTETTDGNKFPPELLGRIDAVVPFQPLSEATLERIAKTRLLDLRRRIHRLYGITMRVAPRVIAYIVENRATAEDSDSGGARAVLQIVDAEIASVVAEYLNRIDVSQYTEMYVWVSGILSSEDKTRVKTEAVIRAGQRSDYDRDGQAIRMSGE